MIADDVMWHHMISCPPGLAQVQGVGGSLRHRGSSYAHQVPFVISHKDHKYVLRNIWTAPDWLWLVGIGCDLVIWCCSGVPTFSRLCRWTWELQVWRCPPQRTTLFSLSLPCYGWRRSWNIVIIVWYEHKVLSWVRINIELFHWSSFKN